MTSTSPNAGLMNPVAVDLAITGVKALLIGAGVDTAATAGNDATKIVGAAITLATFAYMIVSRLRLRAQKRAAIIAPAAMPVTKLHL